MKKFNINDYMYIQITEKGWKHLESTVGSDYIRHCINAVGYRKEIEGQIWHRLQAHCVFDLLPMGTGFDLLYNPNIMFDEISLK